MMQFPDFLRSENSIFGKNLEKNKKFLFHHIPKTAGSTFRGFLNTMFETSEICPAETVDELEKYKQNKDYRLYAGHFSYGAINKFLNNAIWVTFLREPNQRIISQYYNHINLDRIPIEWVKRIENRPEWQEYMRSISGCSLREWILLPNKWANSLTCNRQVQAFIPQDLRIKINDWSLYDEELLKIAKQNLKSKFSFLGIQEYFDLSFLLFSATFGILPLQVSNSFTTNINNKKKFGEKYKISKDLTDLINSRNKMDWELYEFGKNLFLSRVETILSKYLSEKEKNIKIIEIFDNQSDIEKKKEILTKIQHGIKKDRKQRLNQQFADNKSDLGLNKTNWKIQDVLGLKGFYRLEKTRFGKGFRWTGSDEIAFIEIKKHLINGKNYKFKLTIISSIDDKALNSIKLKINNISIKDLEIKKNYFTSNYTVSFDHSLTETSYYHLIEIKSDIFIEDNLRKDARKIGLAISNIRIS